MVYNRLETLWDGIKQNNTKPEDYMRETKQKLLSNKLELNVDFRNHRVEGDELKQRLTEYYRTIAFVDPLVKDAPRRLENDIAFLVADFKGVIISCQSDDMLGYCCPAAELINNDNKLKKMVEMGNVLEVNYDNGIRSQLIPIFNEHGEIQFYCGVSGSRPITAEAFNILYLAAQLVQERYKYGLIIDEYASSLINAMPECVVLLDENARIINVNEQFLNLLKIRDKSILKGMPITNIISQQGPIYDLNFISDTEDRFNINFWGKDIPCHIINKQPIYTPYGNQLILSFNHLTDKFYIPTVPSANILPDTFFSFDEIIGKNPEIDRIKSMAKRAAKSLATVLIEGESGTGKELFAEAIHWESQRKGLFLAINCGAIPSELIQSELFGYEEGAFTGAKKRGSPGKFELADGGTVFLDEIGEMPVNMQVSLLRFLQDKTVTRVGGYIPKKVDVRIIAATNRNLKDEVEKGNFREDLYYRLNVINLQIPPLRKRKEDIPLIANCLLEKLCNRYEIPPIKMSRSAGATLMNYNWPGNVRELENIIERAFIMRQGEEMIFDSSVITPTSIKGSSKEQIEANMGKIEKEAIENHLRVYGGNISKTAQALGISRKTLYKKIKMLNINRDTYVS